MPTDIVWIASVISSAMQALFSFPLLKYALGWVAFIEKKKNKNNNKKKKPLRAHPEHNMHFTYTLEHALVILKCMVNEHVFVNVVPLNTIFNAH